MEIVLFVKDDNQACPFERWLNSLRDRSVRGRVYARLNRIRLGNLGDCKALGQGLWELRLDFGPGYRVYFGRRSSQIVVLLCGGSKSSQARDIAVARNYWRAYQEQKNESE